VHVARVEDPAAVRARAVVDHLAHELDAETAAAALVEHVDVGEVNESARVELDRTGEADLAVAEVSPHALRVLRRKPPWYSYEAWITFSAHQDDATTVVQIEVLLRANDPMYEVTMALGGHKRENAFWLATLHNLAARFSVDATPTLEQTCVDRKRQWKNAKNIRHNAAIRSTIWTATHPRHWFRRTREA